MEPQLRKVAQLVKQAVAKESLSNNMLRMPEMFSKRILSSRKLAGAW
jgi:hypothetical protein